MAKRKLRSTPHPGGEQALPPSSEALPGAGPFTDPPGVPLDVGEFTARLDSEADRATELGSKLATRLTDRLSALEATRNGMATLLEGQVGSKLAAEADRSGKIVGKLEKNSLKKLGQAYTYAFPYGITYPSDQQVVYGLESGDVFGSMGLQAPQGFTAGGAAGGELGPGQVPGVGGGVGVGAPPPYYPPIGPVILPVVGGPPPNWGPPPPPPAPGVPMPPIDRFPVPPPPPPRGLPPPVPPGAPGGPGGPAPVRPGGPVACQDGDPTCAPSGGGGGGPGGGPPGQPTEGGDFGGGTGPGTCPPGFHWVTDGTANDVLVDVPTVPPGNPYVNAQGQTCQVPLASTPEYESLRGQWVAFRQARLFVPILYDGRASVPNPPSQWDVVYVHRSRSDNGGAAAADLAVVVPAGTTVFFDPNTGLVYAHAYLPDWGCRLNEWARRQWIAGTAGGRCEPDAGPPPAEVCGPPVPLDCAPPKPLPKPPGKSDSDVFCDLMAGYVKQFDGFSGGFASFLGMAAGGGGVGDWVASAISNALIGTNQPIIPALVQRFTTWINGLHKDLISYLSCDVAAFTPILAAQAIFGLIHKYTGIVPEQLLDLLGQASHTACQSKVPTASDANRGYLSDQFDDATWECLVKAAGERVGLWQGLRDGERKRLDTHDLNQLYMRGQVDEQRWRKAMRAQGVTDDTDLGELLTAQAWWPNYTDVVQWMGKDAFDEDIVDRFRLDEGFAEKFTDQLKEYADGLGITPDQMKRIWRVHWRNIGLQQMADCARRLRPGKVSADIETTEKDLRDAMLQQDIQPFWVDRLIATQFRVLTREDAHRMYTLHQIDVRELSDYLKDGGYTPDDADKLADHYRVQRDLAEARQNGLPTIRMAVRRYASGEMTRHEMNDITLAYSYYAGQDQEILAAADLARDQYNRRQTIMATKRRYTRGLMSAGDAAAELAAAGVDADEIPALMRTWDQIMKRRTKEVAAAELCKWRKSHLIGPSQQLGALMRLGYSSADANHIVAQCTVEMAQAAGKAQEKAEAQAMKAAEKKAKSDAAAAKAATKRGRVNVPAGSNGSANGAAGH